MRERGSKAKLRPCATACVQFKRDGACRLNLSQFCPDILFNSSNFIACARVFASLAAAQIFSHFAALVRQILLKVLLCDIRYLRGDRVAPKHAVDRVV